MFTIPCIRDILELSDCLYSNGQAFHLGGNEAEMNDFETVQLIPFQKW